MISQLEALVFGTHNFEKVKLEERYLQIYSLINSIHPKSIEEFEVMEKCLYKIKEQLRVKSSNLNTIIKKQNKLTYPIIKKIISTLEQRRYEILQLAFSNESLNPSNSPSINSRSNNQDISMNLKSQNNQKTISNSNIDTQNSESNNSISNTTFNSNEKNISTNSNAQEQIESNSPEEYITISQNGPSNIELKSAQLFKKSKKILALLFDTKLYEATMLYIQSILLKPTNAQCIGVKANNHLKNPLLISRDPNTAQQLDLIYDTILKHKESTNFNNNNNFVEIGNPVSNIETHKDKEDSLEGIVESQPRSTHTQYFNPKNFDNEDSTITISRGDEISIEKENNTSKNETKKNTQDIITSYSDTSTDKTSVQNSNTNSNSSNNSNIDSITNSKTTQDNSSQTNTNLNSQNQNKNDSNSLYQDENIEVSLNKHPKQLGQLELHLKNTNSLSSASQQVTVHSILSAKIFLETIFQSMEAQGTMLVESLNSSKIDLLPRFTNDNIFTFNGESKSDEVLTQVQQKIHNRMIQELRKEENSNNKEATNSSNNENCNKTTAENNQEKVTDSKNKRAKYLLSSLRRLG